MDEIKINKDELEEKILAPNKSVDVFNALNLFNEELGALYETQGYNPFGEDFELTEEFAQEVLQEKKLKHEVFPENFLEYGNKEVAKHFNSALENNNDLIAKFKDELEKCTDPKVKKQMQKMLVTLKNRSELLKLNIQKLKQKDPNALKMYMEMFGLDSELSELLKDGFTEKVNNNIVIQKMLDMCRVRSNIIRQKITRLAKDTNVTQADMEKAIKEEEKQQTKTVQEQVINNTINQEIVQEQIQETQTVKETSSQSINQDDNEYQNYNEEDLSR